jgi:hypothetical protein
MSKQLRQLSAFVLNPENPAELLGSVSSMDPRQFGEFVSLLDKHHILVRVLAPLLPTATATGNSPLAERVLSALDAERERIREALQSLETVCAELESAGCPVVVIKTLEHWPDFGSDLDLFTTGDERCALQVLRNKFRARGITRSLGDHLSHKRSFRLPGIQTTAEVHVRRLGQAGEHVQLAKRLITRRKPMHVNGYVFQVPASEERVIVASLERMYRHLYFRICDILNLAGLLVSDELDFAELQSVAEQSGIWPGVAACLKIVSDYISSYGGTIWAMPPQVSSVTELSSGMLFERDGLWHLPVMPQGASLFVWELTHAIRRGDLAASARLSLLPPLASVASLAYAVTGNSGRIW